MILPNVRASFGRTEAGAVLGLLARGDADAHEAQEQRLRSEGFDVLLDDPRTLNALLSANTPASVPPGLVYYVLVRHALLEVGVTQRTLADYVAALLVEFGTRDRAHRVAEGEARFDYLVDIVAALDTARGRHAFLLQAHLGNFALWVSGLFPDRIVARVHRRGAPGLEYYEELGASGFRMAAGAREAGRYGLDGVLRACAETFPELRVGLNRIADRYLFARRGDPVDRLLRQIGDEARLRGGPG